MLKVMKDNGQMDNAGADDLTFASKMENENTEAKIQSLFAKAESELEAGVQEVEDKIDDPYQTVNEGLTTDTSVTTDLEGATGHARTAQEDLSDGPDGGI